MANRNYEFKSYVKIKGNLLDPWRNVNLLGTYEVSINAQCVYKC